MTSQPPETDSSTSDGPFRDSPDASAVPMFSGADEFERASRTFRPIRECQKPDSEWRSRLPASLQPSGAREAAASVAGSPGATTSSSYSGVGVGGCGSRTAYDSEAKLRERLLKGNLNSTILRKESIERRLRGPLQVARRGGGLVSRPGAGVLSAAAGGVGLAAAVGGSSSSSGGGGAASAAGSSPMPDLIVPQKRSLRPTSPTYESAFRRHVVNRPPSPGAPRRKASLALSPSNSFNKTKRTPSPNVADISTEMMRKKVEKARKAKIYLLQQAGPNSFVIACEGGEGKVKVVVGPQTCSCGKGASGCVHILFVMLRVFQLDDNDVLVWSRQLRNFEVETLFNGFHARRTQRIRSAFPSPSGRPEDASSADGSHVTHEAGECAGGGGATAAAIERHGSTSSSTMRAEEETSTCPICLLHMDEGEQLVLCEACRNLLHQQCISVWFRLCSRQGDVLSCPLCRAKWRHLDPESLSSGPAVPADSDSVEHTVGVHGAVPSVTGLGQLQPHVSTPSSSAATGTAASGAGASAVPPDVVATLPRSEPIPEESLAQAAPWIELFGNDLVSCIFSRNWVVRENALRHLSRESVRMLVMRNQALLQSQSSGSADLNAVLECCCQILAMMCGDPVYKVYVAALRALRTLLSYTSCTSEDNIVALRKYLQPVLHSILLKCADSNRRTSQLSLSTLSEFAKGQAGELAVSREIRGPEAQEGLGGILFVLRSMLDDFDVSTTHWQWLLGRLAAMEKLMDEFPADFSPLDAGPDQGTSAAAAASISAASLETVLYSVVRFSLKSMKLAHTRVLRTAKKVFLVASRHVLPLSSSALSRVRDMLALVDLGMQSRLEKRLLEVAHRTACLDPSSSALSSTSAGGGGRSLSVAAAGLRPSSAPQSRVPSPGPYSCGSDSLLAYNDELASMAFAPQSHRNGRSKTVFGCLYQPAVATAASAAMPPAQRHVDRPTAVGSSSSEQKPPVPPLGQGSDLDRADVLSDGEEAVVRRTSSAGATPESRHRKALHRRSASYTHAVDGSEGIGTADGHGGASSPAAVVASGCDEATTRRPTSSPKKLPLDEAALAEKLASDVPSSSLVARSLDVAARAAVGGDPDLCSPEVVTAAGATTTRARTTPTATGQAMSATAEVGSSAALSLLTTDVPTAAMANIPSPRHDGCAPSSSVAATGGSGAVSTADTTVTAAAAAAAAAATSSGSGDEQKTSDSSVLLTEDLSELSIISPSDNNAAVSFGSEVALFSPLRRTPDSLDSGAGSSCGGGGIAERRHCKDDVELEEAIALARAMDVSMHQDELPRIPGLCVRNDEETITIHIQENEAASSAAVQYLENVHWRRGKTLGSGAFSTCYQARDVRTGILMAVKQISFCRNTTSEQEKVCHAVREEIEMMARLNHPHVIRILGATQTGCHFNMFVEWMPGGSVAHLLDLYGAFSEPVISSYTHQVLMGLAYLHDNQVLHRDLKGANLLVDSTGKHLRIGDFGACARLATSMTGAGEFKGQMLGTIAFMAPEVLRGEHYGRACDVWGVGCVMIEMATTRPPWSASAISNHLKLIFMIASSTVPPPVPGNMSPAVRDLMLRCLETNPSFRPPARELLQHPLFTRSHQFRGV